LQGIPSAYRGFQQHRPPPQKKKITTKILHEQWRHGDNTKLKITSQDPLPLGTYLHTYTAGKYCRKSLNSVIEGIVQQDSTGTKNW
jgi:hypothetical protein